MTGLLLPGVAASHHSPPSVSMEKRNCTDHQYFYKSIYKAHRKTYSKHCNQIHSLIHSFKIVSLRSQLNKSRGIQPKNTTLFFSQEIKIVEMEQLSRRLRCERFYWWVKALFLFWCCIMSLLIFVQYPAGRNCGCKRYLDSRISFGIKDQTMLWPVVRCLLNHERVKI